MRELRLVIAFAKMVIALALVNQVYKHFIH